MLTIGVISDTHGWLDPIASNTFERQQVCAICHAGDIGSEDVLTALMCVAPVTAVRGNIDGGGLRFLPLEAVLELANIRIGVRHISGSPGHPKVEALEFIRRERLDVLVAGHSHLTVVGRVNGALWINPGAAGRQGLHDDRWAALLRIDDTGSLSLDRVFLGQRGRAR